MFKLLFSLVFHEMEGIKNIDHLMNLIHTKTICNVFNSKVLGTVSIGCTEGVEKKSIRRGIPRRQSNFLAFSASFTQCSAHATFHLQVYGVHDLWCKLLLCTTVLVQDAGAGVKNDSMVCKKLDIFEMVEINKPERVFCL